MISDEILDQLLSHQASHLPAAVPMDRSTLVDLLERYEQLRDGRPQACPWGHPYVEENTYNYPDGPRYCRHCNIIQQRAVRAGMTMGQYYERYPATRPYQGFPVVGAKRGRSTGMTGVPPLASGTPRDE